MRKKSHHTRGPLGNEGFSAFHADPTPGVTFGMSTFFTQVNLYISTAVYHLFIIVVKLIYAGNGKIASEVNDDG